MNREKLRAFNTTKALKMAEIIRVTINIVPHVLLINLIVFTYLEQFSIICYLLRHLHEC